MGQCAVWATDDKEEEEGEEKEDDKEEEEEGCQSTISLQSWARVSFSKYVAIKRI